MADLDLKNTEGKVVGSVKLSEAFDGPINRALLWQAVNMYRANARQGTHQTKTRAEVRGGGKKPWRQKHTGRARHGSIRSPIWRGGGVVFGPHPRDYSTAMPRRARRAALLDSLRSKVVSKTILAIDSWESLEPKTKSLAGALKKLNLSESVLLVVDAPNVMLTRISQNIPKVSVIPVKDLNCFEVLLHRKLVLAKSAIEPLEKMFA